AILFGSSLVRRTLAARYEAGARFLVQSASAPVPADHDTLFVVRADRRLEQVTGDEPVTTQEGDSLVLLGSTPPSH
ncbi:MAG: sodium:proton exchanger, partial [Streptomyces sp.]|nr:sodium:proton exchanger [Streptomyces sp.]